MGLSSRSSKSWLFGVAAVLTSLGAVAPASADVRVGLLECDVGAGVGFVVGSSKTLNCVYRPEGSKPQYYAGTIRRIGLDLGATVPGQLVWGVFAATPSSRKFSLAGDYSGPGAGLTVGPGLTANALVGGNGTGLTLQPLSLSTQAGLNLSAGIGTISLQPTGGPAPVRMYRRHRHYHHHA